MNIKTVAISIIATSMLVSCSASSHKLKDDASKNKVIYTEAKETPLISSNPEERYNEDIPFLTNMSYKLNKNPLPAAFSKSVFIQSKIMSSRDIVEIFHSESGIPIKMNADVLSFILNRDNSSVSDMTLNYRGTLKGALDVLVMKIGASWDYENESINIFKYKTKSLMLPLLGSMSKDGLISLNSTLSKISSDGGTFEVDTSSSTITIIDTPDVISAVEKYISYKKDQMVKQVLIKVNVYKITKSSQESDGFSWLKIRNSIGQGFGLMKDDSLTSRSPSNVTGNVALFDPSYNGSNLNDGNVFLDALKEQGDVSIITSTSILTVNMEDTPISRMSNDEGISISIRPVVLDNNKIVVNINMDYSKLLSIDVDKDGIQHTNVGHDRVEQHVIVNSGQMVAISGLETNSYMRLDTGIGHHTHKRHDGRLDGNSIKDIFIVTLTPTLVTL